MWEKKEKKREKKESEGERRDLGGIDGFIGPRERGGRRDNDQEPVGGGTHRERGTHN